MKATTIALALFAGYTTVCEANTVAWYRFDEGTPGERVGSSIIIKNAGNPGHLTAKCQQVDTAGAFSNTDTGYMPASIAAFPSGIGISDAVTRRKYANDRTFFFHNANYDSNHASTSVNYSMASAVTVAHDTALELPSFTVELFFKSAVANNQSNGDQALVVMPNETWLAWAIMLTKDGAISGQFFNTASYTLAYAAGANDGKWHHVAMTYDGATTTATLFFDYAQVSTRTIPGSLVYDSAKPFSIGCMSGRGDRKYVGSIDEVRISDTILSVADFLHRAAYVAAADNEDTACYVPCDYTTLANLDGFATVSTLKDINAAGYGDITAEITYKPTNGASPAVDDNELPYATLYGASFAGNDWSWMSVTNTASFTLPTGTSAGYSGSILVNDIKDNTHTVLNGSFTIEFFVRIPSAPSGNKFLMNLGRTLASGSLLYILVNGTTGNTDFYIQGNERVKFAAYAGFCDNNWHHVAITYDRDALTAKAYVDYRNVGTAENLDFDYALTVSDTPAALQINNAYGWREFGLDGAWIDEFRLSRRALSRKELLSPVLNERKPMTIVFR